VFNRSAEIVGIVGNERFLGLNQPAAPAVYPVFSQLPMGSGSLVVRTAGTSPDLIVREVRRQARAIDPELPLFDVASLDDVVSESVAGPRFDALLFGAFAALALLLAMIGVHGVLSLAVSRRGPELGLRVAIGATPRDLVTLVLGEGMRLNAVGIGLGLAGALIVTRLLRSLLFDTSPTDTATFVVVSVALTLVAVGACVFPARRAARVDAMKMLRGE
jgi:putative ABC transport system permease protein